MGASGRKLASNLAAILDPLDGQVEERGELSVTVEKARFRRIHGAETDDMVRVVDAHAVVAKKPRVWTGEFGHDAAGLGDESCFAALATAGDVAMAVETSGEIERLSGAEDRDRVAGAARLPGAPFAGMPRTAATFSTTRSISPF